MEHIYLATPTMDNTLTTGVNWLHTKAMKAHPTRRFTARTFNGYSPVEWARNVICHTVRQTDAERLWMVDDDMNPMDNAFDLLDTEGDIVAGFFLRFQHRLKKDPPSISPCAFNVNGNGHVEPVGLERIGELFPVDAVGSGSMIIRREVLDDPAMLLPGHDELPAGAPAALFKRRYAANGQVLMGADIDFCLRAKAAGYSVIADFRVPFGQIDSINSNEILDLIGTYAEEPATCL